MIRTSYFNHIWQVTRDQLAREHERVQANKVRQASWRKYHADLEPVDYINPELNGSLT